MVLILVATGAAFVLNIVFTPILLGISHRFKWYDNLDHRKIHSGMIPRIGGVGIFLAFVVVSVLLTILRGGRSGTIVSIARYLPFLAAFLIVNLLGLVDDFANLRPRIKIVFQGLAGLIVTVFAHGFSSIYLPFTGTSLSLGAFSYVLTFLWVIGLCNAVNLIDGLDGLGGGTSAIAAIAMGVVFALQNNATASLLAFALGGAVLGFLVFNMPPARLFMGDSGALFIGFALATFPVMEPTAAPSGMTFWLSVTVVLIPILDTFAAILRRIRRRSPIHRADREHMHHKLLDLGISTHGILGIIYALCIFLGASAILWAHDGSDTAFGWIVASWVVSVGFFLVLDVVNRRRRHAVEHPSHST